MENISQLIKQLEIELLEPNTRWSTERLDELLADDFFEFGQSWNIYVKADTLDHVPKESRRTFEMRDFKVTELDQDIMLATYHIDFIEISTGERKESLRSSIWKYQNGRWQMAFHQGTLIRK